MSKRRSYTASEKAAIALAAIKEEMTMSEIASKYSVHPTQIKAWKKQALEVLGDAFSKKEKRVKAVHEAALAELYEKIGRLEVENDFLKKKRALFAG